MLYRQYSSYTVEELTNQMQRQRTKKDRAGNDDPVQREYCRASQSVDQNILHNVDLQGHSRNKGNTAAYPDRHFFELFVQSRKQSEQAI